MLLAIIRDNSKEFIEADYFRLDIENLKIDYIAEGIAYNQDIKDVYTIFINEKEVYIN